LDGWQEPGYAAVPEPTTSIFAALCALDQREEADVRTRGGECENKERLHIRKFDVK
jgi:hypothetical protein